MNSRQAKRSIRLEFRDAGAGMRAQDKARKDKAHKDKARNVKARNAVTRN